ncbi:hypothetical protein GCM10008959_20290 [Deinococcus seoulensis]|uniref:O-antigen ligase-related domain-containing protein n=1 Tax=Deinococcus seoulensis TaxID=1837379 RepID=A0ABQ2RQS9_9DEIO|nr:O-antigen ligase family protein [Deinococcus seoulensis]GGR58544.1 hypothetical protein GCM10008959_20290 [Deinococcus seoulensis]
MTSTTVRDRTATGFEWVALGTACLTLAWGPLAQGSTFSWGMSGLILLGCLTTALTVTALGIRGRVTIHNPWWLASALLFLTWIWLSTTWAPYQWEAYRWAGVWTAVIGTAVSLHVLAITRARQWVILSSMLITGAATLILAFLQTRGTVVPGFEYYPGTGPELVTGPYFNPSHFSGYLIILAGLSTGLLLFTRPHLHSPLLIALLAALHWLNLKTDSSSIPAVLLATATPFLVWVWVKHRVTGATLTALVLAAGIGGATYFTTPAGQATFKANQQKLGISRDWEAFVRERQAVWRYGQELWADHRVEGAGIGQFYSEAPTYRREERAGGTTMDRKSVNYTHNDALQLASEIGTVGLVLFGALFASTLLGTGLMTLLAWGLVPVLVFVGIYDAHLTAIPGTSAVALAFLGMAAGRTSARDERRKVKENPVTQALS